MTTLEPRHPSRRALLASAASLPWLAPRLAQGARPDPEAPRPPNVLVLVADDTSRLNIGAYGNRSATTPNVDRIAREGLRFERAYTTVGLCTPSRASLYTGLYPSVHGATGFDPIHADVATAPELLAKAGVLSALIGKVHVEPEAKFPFDFLATGPEFLKDRSEAAFVGALSKFMASAGERPFACYVNFKDPHRPFGHKKDESQGGSPRVHRPESIELFPFLWDTPLTRADLARYYDALKHMDDTVGAILRALDESGRSRDTLVIFTSDNGMPFPYGKATLYEAGINLPLVLRWPGVVEPGSVHHSPVGLIDILPTVLDLHGQTPAGLHGRSLLPLLRGEVETLRSSWFAMHTSQKVGRDCPSRSVRVGDLKYIRNLTPEIPFQISGFNRSRTWQSWLELAEREQLPELERLMDRLILRPAEELYDLASDPFERSSLVGVSARDADLRAMRTALVAHMEEFRDADGLALLSATERTPASGSDAGARPDDEPGGSSGR